MGDFQPEILKRFAVCNFPTEEVWVRSSILTINIHKMGDFQPRILYLWTKKFIH